MIRWRSVWKCDLLCGRMIRPGLGGSFPMICSETSGHTRTTPNCSNRPRNNTNRDTTKNTWSKKRLIIYLLIKKNWMMMSSTLLPPQKWTLISSSARIMFSFTKNSFWAFQSDFAPGSEPTAYLIFQALVTWCFW